MSPPAAAGAASAGDAAAISRELPRRRRRLGLSLVGLGVFGLAAQSGFEWLLPYDPASLDAMRRLSHAPALGAASLVWAWALLCAALLVSLALERARPLIAALACGLALGSAHAAAGGAAASLAMLLLVGVASLGWQAQREGGLILLLATAATVSLWDIALSDFPSLWIVAAVLVAMFVWIDRQHIRANDRRLFAALAERDGLIRSLDQRSAELTALQGARTRLLAGISHDLRQPLQAVRLFAEALQARCAGTADGRDGQERWPELLRQQMRAADDAVAMLDQFSEFSAIEQGALQSRPEPVELRDLLDAIAAGLQAAHPAARLSLSVHGRQAWLHIDRSQLTRLVQNLAANAVRYSLGARPGVTARVVLAVRPRTAGRASAGLAIEIMDNGCGIPADKLDAIFEPYVQLQGGSGGASRGGRGLGLAIVRGLVAQLGLQLAPVRSVLGRGTHFRLLVPAALRLPDPVAAPGTAVGQDAVVDDTAHRPRLPVPPRQRLDGWLIAVLEDEAAPRAALRAALEGVGATIVDADSPAELEARLDAEARYPDALVFDLDLGPGQPDGLATLDGLRAAWELVVPAVIVTGRIAVMGTVPMPRRCSLLPKPVPLDALVGALLRLAPPAPPPVGSPAATMADAPRYP